MAKIEANTKALTFNENISLKAEIVKLGAKEVTVKLTATGGEVKNYRYINTATKNWNFDDPATEGKLALSDYWNIRETTERELVINRLKSDTEYSLFVLGLDAEGTPTRMVKCVYTPTLDIKIVLKDNPSWNTAKPSITGLPDPVPEYYSGPVFFDVTPTASCVKYFVYVDSKTKFMNKNPEELTKFIVTDGDAYEGAQKDLGFQYTPKDAL
ncbi:lipoprotein, partial [gut metagenome]